MATRLRKRFYVESLLGGIAGVLGVVTVFSREWIEVLTSFEPDGGDGSAEWLLVVGLLAAAAVLGRLAQGEWRRASHDPGQGFTESAR
jgi:hypothetical protein